MALFWLRRKLRRLGNLLVLSTVLLSALTSLAHSYFVGIFCNCNGQESIMELLHKLADPEASLVGSSSSSSWWSVLWCHLVHSFTPHRFFFLHFKDLCKLHFLSVVSFFLQWVLTDIVYSRLSSDLLLCGVDTYCTIDKCVRWCLLSFCLYWYSVLSPLLLDCW